MVSPTAGAKLWAVASPEQPRPTDRICEPGKEVDAELSRREGVHHCEMHPGEAIGA